MLRYIFKNYDHFLESINSAIGTLFSSKEEDANRSLQLKPADILDLEIKKHEENLKQKENSIHKHEIMRMILYLHLKKKALITTNKYIKRAQDILKDEIDDSIYEAITYLNRVPKNLDNEQIREIHVYKAYLYELLEDFEEASNEYKQAIKYDKTPNTLAEYKEFIERSREVMSWEKKSHKHNTIYNTANIHRITSIEDMPEVVERLKNIAKYYARSPKSRTLGKKYFREVLKMYKKLVVSEPNKYTCEYIEALLDAVELFMMPTTLLKDAQNLLYKGDECQESRVYLLERIKELKQKNFIKKSKVFEISD